MWVGASLAALFGSLELGANHPQITYYFLIVALFLWLSELWCAYKEKALKSFGRATALLAVAAVVALGSNFSPLWYTFKHQKYTTRGVSEVVSDAEARQDKIAYNTAWSYGKAESFNMLVPSYMGAWSGDYNEEAVAILQSDGVNEVMLGQAIYEVTNLYREYYPDITVQHIQEAIQAGDQETMSLVWALADRYMNRAAVYASNYWGDQPFTAGPTYLGAAAIFLAFIGLMLVNGRDRWWIVASMVFMLLLAWGGNFMGFYNLMYDILPGYHNFRTVSMALVVLEWAVPLMAAVALWRVWSEELAFKRVARLVAIAFGVVVALVVLMIVVADYGVADINSELGNEWWVEQLKEAVYNGRREAMMADVWRSMLYVVFAAAALLVFAWTRENGRNKLGYVAMIAVVAIVVFDLVGVGARYLGEDKWRGGEPTEIKASAANLEILQDKELGYRVFDIDNYGSARASYFHRSVDGYHGAKLGRYQDVMDHYIAQQGAAVLAMLNTKYVIDGGEVYTLADAFGAEPLGAAWFVEGVYTQPTAAKELESLGYVDLATKAVVSESVEGLATMYNTAGSIALVEYAPNYLKYEYEVEGEALAVFSEIYFPDGWTAYIDGEEARYFAADYTLRAMELPQGKHTVEWRFKAPGWGWATAVTGISSWIILLGLVAIVVVELRKRLKR